MSKWGRGYFEGGGISASGEERSGRIARETHNVLLGSQPGGETGFGKNPVGNDSGNEDFLIWTLIAIVACYFGVTTFFEYQNLGGRPTLNGAVASGMLVLAVYAIRVPAIFLVSIGTVALFALYREANQVIVNSVAVACMLALFSYAPRMGIIDQGWQNHKFWGKLRLVMQDLGMLSGYLVASAAYLYWLHIVVDQQHLVVSVRSLQVLSAVLIALGLLLSQIDGLKEIIFASLADQGHRQNPDAIAAGYLGSFIVWAVILLVTNPQLVMFWHWEIPVKTSASTAPRAFGEWARPQLPKNWYFLYAGVFIFVAMSFFSSRRAVRYMGLTGIGLAGGWAVCAVVTVLVMMKDQF